MFGGEGNDTLVGQYDVVDGGPGDDYIVNSGYNYDNTIIVNHGSGFDNVVPFGNTAGSNRIAFGEGIAIDDLSVQIGSASNSGNALLAIGIGDNEGVLISSSSSAITDLSVGYYVFAEGRELSLDQILAIADDGVIGLQNGTENNDCLLGSVADDTIDGLAGADWIESRDNEDYLYGGDDNDIISAGAGQDAIWGGAGDDIVAGGKGDDRLDDEAGSDVYCFNRGDGHDFIDDYSGRLSGAFDTISFGTGVNPEDIAAYVNSDGNLVLVIKGSEDSISINWFDPLSHEEYTGSGITRLQFIDADGHARIFDLFGVVSELKESILSADVSNPLSLFTESISNWELTGSVMQAGGDYAVAYAQTGDLFDVPTYYTGGSGDDIIYGGSGVDIIDAGDGNNIIDAGDGDNKIYTGTGDDYITTGN